MALLQRRLSSDSGGLMGAPPPPRNPSDRVARVTVEFYAFPVEEYLMRRKYAGKEAAGIFRSLFPVMAAAASSNACLAQSFIKNNSYGCG